MSNENPEHELDTQAAMLAEAHDVAKRVMAPYLNGVGPDAPPPSDAEILATGFAILMRQAQANRAVLSRCGWCVAAAGDDDAAWKAALQYDLSSIKAHTLVCPHNPLVTERGLLVGQLARYERVVEAAKACKATRDEASKKATPVEMRDAVLAGLKWQELFDAVAALEAL